MDTKGGKQSECKHHLNYTYLVLIPENEFNNSKAEKSEWRRANLRGQRAFISGTQKSPPAPLGPTVPLAASRILNLQLRDQHFSHHWLSYCKLNHSVTMPWM